MCPEPKNAFLDPKIAGLPAAVRADACAKLEIMQWIDGQRNVSDACRDVCARYGHMRGHSKHTLRTLYYKWVRGGRTLMSLADKARAPDKPACPRAAMDNIYKTYCGRHQRANKRAWKQLVLDIRRGVRFEGVGDWRDLWRACYKGERPPAQCPTGWVPPGMTYRNFQRYAPLTKYEEKAVRIGTKAARAHVPGVYTTRAGLLPGQIYQFDDVTHDDEVVAPDLAKVLVRAQEFACNDVASTHKIAYGLRPQVPREDGTRDSLKEVEMLWLACYVLTDVGYHRDGCTWCVEHGTAAIREPLRKIIDRLTGGAIRYRDSDILGAAVHKGLFNGAGKGNFKTKALMEGSHRIHHYESGMLPAQTGGISRGGDRPEQLDGLERYAASMIKAWERMPPHLRDRLWYGGLSWSGYGRVYDEIVHAIGSRHDHDIEGWEANEWFEAEWSADGRGNWMPVRNIAMLKPASQDLALACMRTPGLTRMRRWSPIEAWEYGQQNLVRMPAWGIVDILGMDRVKRVRVQDNHLIEFEDRFLGPGTHRFAGAVVCPDGSSMALCAGREYGLFVTPYSTRQAFMVELSNGAVLGAAPQWAAVKPLDTLQVSTMQEAQGRMVAALDAPIIARHQDDADDRLAAMRHNEILVDAAGPEPRARVGARTRKPTRNLIADLAAATSSRQALRQETAHAEEW